MSDLAAPVEIGIPHTEFIARNRQEIGPFYQKKEVFRSEFLPATQSLSQARELGHFLHSADRYINRVINDTATDANFGRLIREYHTISTAVAQSKGENKTSLEQIAEFEKAQLRLREQITGHLHSDYDYFFHVVDQYDFTPAFNPPEQPALKEIFFDSVVEETISCAIARSGLPSRTSNPVDESLLRLVRNLVENSGDFNHLRQQVTDYHGSSSQEVITGIEATASAKVSILMMDPDIRSQAFRLWLRETSSKEKHGITVYETPYYQNLFRRCERVGDMENGIGGKIYYGPPGTGKTEFGIEFNRRQGFETRVISMHYWTDFAALLGESPVPLGLQKATGYQQRLLAARSEYGNISADDFIQRLTNLHRQRVEGGKAREKGGELDMILAFTVGIDKSKFSGRSLTTLSDSEKSELHKAFIGYLDAQALGASIGLETGDDPMMSWVNGEILIAIDEHKRVMLDEIDKAGPNSLAGISRLLAMRPGKNIDLKGKSVTVPSWFKIDATSNELVLDPAKQYLYDRFKHINIDYPPPVDELMIAAARLSDGEGNILLDNMAQQQTVNFFLDILPQIRSLYKQGVLKQPFSLRGTKEFCNLLVDPLTKRRTGISVERAAEMVFLEERMYGQISEDETGRNTSEATDTIRYILSVWRPVIHEIPTPINLAKTSFGGPELTTRMVIQAALERITSSPIARYAMAESLGDTVSKLLPELNFVPITLDNQTITQAQQRLADYDTDTPSPREDFQQHIRDRMSPEFATTSLNLNVGANTEGEGRKRVTVEAVIDQEGRSTYKYEYIITAEEKLYDCSADGKAVLTVEKRKAPDDEKKDELVYRLYQPGPPGKTGRNILGDEATDAKIKTEAGLTPLDNALYVYTPSTGKLELVAFYERQAEAKDEKKTKKNTKFTFTVPGNVKRYEFSPDGRLLLTERVDGETQLFDLTRGLQPGTEKMTILSPITYFPGQDYRFIDSSLIVKPGDKNAIAILKS